MSQTIDLKSALAALHRHVTQAVKSQEVVEKLGNIVSEGQALLTELRRMPALKRYLELYYNTVVGLLSSVDNDTDLSLREWSRMESQINKAYAAMLEKMNKEVDFDAGDVPIEMVRLKHMSFDPMNPQRTGRAIEKEALYNKQDKEQLLKWRSQAQTLEAGVIRSGVFLGSAPIITLMPLDRSKLTRAGIPNEMLAGYTVLLEQTVIGVSRAWVDRRLDSLAEAFAEDKTASKKIKTKVQPSGAELKMKEVLRKQTTESITQAWSEMHMEMAKEAVQTIMGQHNSRLIKNSDPARNRQVHGFELMSEQSYAWEGARWFWIVRSPLIPIIQRCSMASGLKGANNWGFAFESKMVKRLSGG